jgi:hypothetical protein
LTALVGLKFADVPLRVIETIRAVQPWLVVAHSEVVAKTVGAGGLELLPLAVTVNPKACGE